MSIFTEEQRHQLAVKLNEKHDIRFIKSESRELEIFKKIISAIDKYMSKYIPDEILAAIQDPNIAVDEAIAEALKDYLTPIICDLVPLPFLPGFIKRKLIDVLIEWIVAAMVSNSKSINDILAQ